MTCASCGAENDYPSGEPGFTTGFHRVHVDLLFHMRLSYFFLEDLLYVWIDKRSIHSQSQDSWLSGLLVCTYSFLFISFFNFSIVRQKYAKTLMTWLVTYKSLFVLVAVCSLPLINGQTEVENEHICGVQFASDSRHLSKNTILMFISIKLY